MKPGILAMLFNRSRANTSFEAARMSKLTVSPYYLPLLDWIH